MNTIAECYKMDYLKLIKKPSDLKYYLVNKYPDNKFFSRENMRFAGDTMSNYGLRVIENSEGNKLFELYRKKPVKYGLQKSAYFDVVTLRKVNNEPA